jgi:hypothetical protein
MAHLVVVRRFGSQRGLVMWSFFQQIGLAIAPGMVNAMFGLLALN